MRFALLALLCGSAVAVQIANAPEKVIKKEEAPAPKEAAPAKEEASPQASAPVEAPKEEAAPKIAEVKMTPESGVMSFGHMIEEEVPKPEEVKKEETPAPKEEVKKEETPAPKEEAKPQEMAAKPEEAQAAPAKEEAKPEETPAKEEAPAAPVPEVKPEEFSLARLASAHADNFELVKPIEEQPAKEEEQQTEQKPQEEAAPMTQEEKPVEQQEEKPVEQQEEQPVEQQEEKPVEPVAAAEPEAPVEEAAAPAPAPQEPLQDMPVQTEKKPVVEVVDGDFAAEAAQAYPNPDPDSGLQKFPTEWMAPKNVLKFNVDVTENAFESKTSSDVEAARGWRAENVRIPVSSLKRATRS